MDDRRVIDVSLRTRLEAFMRDGERVYEGDVEALHRTRVASRRLRELVPVLGLSGDTARKVGQRLKKVTKRLGVVRELDVLMLMIDELGRDSRYSSTAVEQVAAAVQRAREEAREQLATRLPLAKLQRVAHRLERAAKQRKRMGTRPERRSTHDSTALMWMLDARAVHRAARLRAAIEAAGVVYASERLHDVRIALKKLRYGLELGEEAGRQHASRDRTTLKAAQDRLGRLHDLEVLIARVRSEQARLSPPTLTAWRDFGSLQRTLEDDCSALHAEYMHAR